tara:strand:- start:95 stop:349 length:255 start_codon:yes stop_codon:yes gene_type:complete
MAKQLKRGDEVVLITGSHKGKRGKVLEVLTNNDRIIVEGVNMQKKHMKKTQENPEGSIIEKEGSVHYSNVMLVEKFDSKQNTKS